MTKLNILCLDIEGGHGGSSKSLFYSLKHIDRNKINPTVICKKSGLSLKYKALGIECIVDSTMPTFTALRKQNRNILYFFLFLVFIWPKSKNFRKNLLNIIEEKKIDIVHCNLISLYLLAKWLKKNKPKIIMTLHVRTNPVNNYTAKSQAKISNKVFDNKIFITENEKESMNNLLYPQKTQGEIIYNSAKINLNFKKFNINKVINPIKIVSLSNYSYERGLDRSIDLASLIPENEKKNFMFYIAGDNKLPRFLPGKIKFLGLRGKTLKDYAKMKKVDKMFKFLGHIKDTESLLNKSDILIYLTRENMPWGRNILESMAFGKSIISIGQYNKFVKTGTTGLLQNKFNLKEIVDWLIMISKNPNELNKYGNNSIKIIKELCDPKKNSLKLSKFWLNTYICKKSEKNIDH